MNLIKRLKNIIEISYSIKSIKNIKEIDDPKTILINTTRPILYPLTLERILGYSARSGHKVIQLLDDGVLAHWDSSTKNQKMHCLIIEIILFMPYIINSSLVF